MPHRLLIVEDDPIHQRIFQLVCKRLGYDATIVDTGAGAVTALASDKSAFDAVVLDLRLPDNDGCSCASHIRKLVGYRLPIIAVTAATIEGGVDRCLSAGINDLLVKPLSIDAFEAAIKKWLGIAGETR